MYLKCQKISPIIIVVIIIMILIIIATHALMKKQDFIFVVGGDGANF